MAAIITSNFTMPQQFAEGIFKKAQSESVLARLSGARPQKFGKENVMVLTAPPKAEVVGEGAQKGETPATYASKVVTPIKIQVTMRCSDEVKWADEDYQLGVLQDMMDNAGTSLGRALDIVGIHNINPLKGTATAGLTDHISATTNKATLNATDYNAAVEAAAGLVIAKGYSPSGFAADPTLAFGLATEKDADGKPLYPGMGFGQDMTSFLGMTAAVGDTVSAKGEATSPTNLLGVVGQFDAFRWGVQRDIAAKLIEFGDPDGLGDLQRLNQVAIRAEIVYGIGVLDKDAFAQIVTGA